MKIKKINAKKAPKATGAYVQATAIGNLMFVSGQLGIDAQTGEMREGVEAQLFQAIQNLAYILKEKDANLASVVKTTVFLKNMEDIVKVNAVFDEAFKGDFPARSCVAVAGLPMNALVEVEAIAVLKK